MKVLHMAQFRKHQRLEFILAEETKQFNESFRKEGKDVGATGTGVLANVIDSSYTCALDRVQSVGLERSRASHVKEPAGRGAGH